jgi:hypothetical protein
MDKIEGAGLGRLSNYKRQKILVRRDREIVEAHTYVGTAHGRKRFLRQPSDERLSAESPRITLTTFWPEHGNSTFHNPTCPTFEDKPGR